MSARYAFLALVAGIFMMPAPVFAEETAKKPPIVVKQGGKRYIFTTQDEKVRSMLLNAKNLRIRERGGADPGDSYRNYYRHHRYIRDHEKEQRRRDRNNPAYNAGYAAGYILSKD